jgi:mannosyl-oligosaccharide alpha-1,2-mannosidase
MAPITTIFLGLIIPTTLALPRNSPPKVNSANLPYETPPSQEDRAQAVIDAFRVSWDGYYKYAFPNDELHPVTNGYSNSR